MVISEAQKAGQDRYYTLLNLEAEIKALEFMCEFTDRAGFAPTMRELGEGQGWSKTKAWAVTGRLAVKGYVELGHGARAIRIVKRDTGPLSREFVEASSK